MASCVRPENIEESHNNATRDNLTERSRGCSPKNIDIPRVNFRKSDSDDGALETNDTDSNDGAGLLRNLWRRSTMISSVFTGMSIRRDLSRACCPQSDTADSLL